MGLEDRIKSFSEKSKQSVPKSMLERNDYTPQTYYEGLQTKQVCIDSIDTLLSYVTEYGIASLVIANDKINEVSYLKENERLSKDIQLSLNKIITELEKLKNDNSGYYSLQYGIDIVVEYMYEPLSPSPVITVYNNHIDFYNLSAFEKLHNNLVQGKNAIMCGNTDFASLATIISNRFSNDRLIGVNAPYVNTVSDLHFSPTKEQERIVYDFIGNRSTDDIIIINDPQDIEQLTYLWFKKTKLLVYIPTKSSHIALSRFEKYLTSDYMIERFLGRLDGIYSLTKENTNVNCRYRTVTTYSNDKENAQFKGLCVI
ncbi:MAG: hypothetical protein K6F27_10910 [Ruminococcus sp.]|nr:hypothetical protein [Ruminococcus sp.]